METLPLSLASAKQTRLQSITNKIVFTAGFTVGTLSRASQAARSVVREDYKVYSQIIKTL